MTSTDGKPRKEDSSLETPKPATVQSLTKTLRELQVEHEDLKQELLRLKRMPSGKIGVVLLIAGSSVLAASVFVSEIARGTSITLAFIGLGLAFWGGLFLFARPVKHVRSILLDSSAVTSYTTFDRIVQDLGYKAKSIYVPPYPTEAYLPEYLKALKEMIVFIPADDSATIPTLEEMAKKQFLLKNPEGICIAPPGLGLLGVIEKELRARLTRVTLENLHELLPQVITNSLGLARSFEIESENELTHVRITGSLYSNLYSQEQGLRSIHFLGCPLTSAIACALAKTTGKLVTITKDNISYNLETIDVWYKTLEA